MKYWWDLPRSLGLSLGTKGNILNRATITRFMWTISIANYGIPAHISLNTKGFIVITKLEVQGRKLVSLQGPEVKMILAPSIIPAPTLSFLLPFLN